MTSAERREFYVRSGHWDDVTLVEQFRKHVTDHPDRVAVVDGDLRATYAELDLDSARVASFLIDAGVRIGDVVAVQLPNWYATVAIGLGAFKAGAIVNPLLPIYRSIELQHMLSVAQTRVIFTPAIYRGFDFRDLVSALRSGLRSLTHHVALEAGDRSFTDELGVRPDRYARSVPAGWVAELIFTSGTEAQPKAVMHTETTLNFSARATWQALG